MSVDSTGACQLSLMSGQDIGGLYSYRHSWSDIFLSYYCCVHIWSSAVDIPPVNIWLSEHFLFSSAPKVHHTGLYMRKMHLEFSSCVCTKLPWFDKWIWLLCFYRLARIMNTSKQSLVASNNDHAWTDLYCLVLTEIPSTMSIGSTSVGFIVLLCCVCYCGIINLVLTEMQICQFTLEPNLDNSKGFLLNG